MDGNGVSIGETEDYNDLGDPKPLDAYSTAQERVAYMVEVERYSEEMLECLESTRYSGRELWIEFTCTFRACTIKALTKSQQAAWVRFLIGNGVHVEQTRSMPRWKALMNCLYTNDFIPSAEGSVFMGEDTLKEEVRIDEGTNWNFPAPNLRDTEVDVVHEEITERRLREEIYSDSRTASDEEDMRAYYRFKPCLSLIYDRNNYPFREKQDHEKRELYILEREIASFCFMYGNREHLSSEVVFILLSRITEDNSKISHIQRRRCRWHTAGMYNPALTRR